MYIYIIIGILYRLGSKRAGALMIHNSFSPSSSCKALADELFGMDTKSAGHWYFETVRKKRK